MAKATYRDAGVDIDAGDALVDRIKPHAARTRIPEALSGIGGFAGLCGLPTDIANPVLVSGTDGVGTKLKLAFLLDRHDTIGIDLVAMCVNDVITVGARPLFFLDYFATGKLDVDRAEQVVKGIADGCALAGCALLGGETAELPGFYAAGEYDLAGFSVGVVDRTKMLDGTKAVPGDVLLGVASSGFHSNGYSLVRKVLVDNPEAPSLDSTPEGWGASLGETLLRPTRIYARAVQAALAAGDVHGFAHITGGGLPGNTPRMLADGLGAELELGRYTRPPVFDLLQKLGDVDEHEMRRTFNIGVGLVVAVAPADAERVADAMRAAGETVFTFGKVIETPGAVDDDRVRFV